MIPAQAPRSGIRSQIIPLSQSEFPVTRVFLPNFEFESELARQLDAAVESRAPVAVPAHVTRLAALRAGAWLGVAQPGDWLLIADQQLADRWTNWLAETRWRAVRIATTLDAVPSDVVITPWGWTTNVLAHATARSQNGGRTASPPLSSIRQVNSRRWSHQLEQESELGLPGQRLLRPGEDWDEHIAAAPELAAGRWVLKHEFGMAGRERIVGNGLPDERQRTRWQRWSAAGHAAIWEPWVDSLGEWSTQWDLEPTGTLRLVGVTQLQSDSYGQYAGSLVRGVLSDCGALEQIVRWGRMAAERAVQAGYFGPLGIDAMVYRAGARFAVRPLQDINARWTMGRLALGFRDLGDAADGLTWRHGTPADRQAAEQSFRQAGRGFIVPTSPDFECDEWNWASWCELEPPAACRSRRVSGSIA